MDIYEKRLREFKNIIEKVEQMNYLVKGILYWDRIVAMPEGAVDVRNEMNSFLGSEMYYMVSGSAFRKYTAYFKNNPQNDQITDAMINRITYNTYFSENTPEDQYHEYLKLIGEAEKVWTRAKKNNDFAEFKPYFQKICDTFTSFARFWGYRETPYDALMSYYEPDTTVKKLDELIECIKPYLIGKTQEMKNREVSELPKINVPEDIQKKVWNEVLEDFGFDFACGRIDTGSFPIVLAYSPYDVRIINEYREDDIKTGIGNILHSGAKGIYVQSVDKRLTGTLLSCAPTMLMDEAVARFYENLIGRSRGFTDYLYDKFTKYTDAFKNVTKDEFYDDFNRVSTGTIRLEADDLTEVLHIIIRYEVERDLINGKISINDVKEIWNDKYEEYLGVRPENDSEGILQDIHWATGYMGYFPVYIRAELIACQIAEAMTKETGSINTLFETGEIHKIYDWMKENIFKYGAVLSTKELCDIFTESEDDPELYIKYIENKYL